MLYDSKRVDKFCLVTIQITVTGNKWYFPDQPQLRGKKIQRIVYYDAAIVPKSPDNVPTIIPGAFKDQFLILYVNNRDDFKMPLSNLFTLNTVPALAAGAICVVNNNGYTPLNNLPIVWEKSYVNAPLSYTPTTAQEVFMFGVFYTD